MINFRINLNGVRCPANRMARCRCSIVDNYAFSLITYSFRGQKDLGRVGYTRLGPCSLESRCNIGESHPIAFHVVCKSAWVFSPLALLAMGKGGPLQFTDAEQSIWRFDACKPSHQHRVRWLRSAQNNLLPSTPNSSWKVVGRPATKALIRSGINTAIRYDFGRCG